LEDSYYNKKVDIEGNTYFYGIDNYVSAHTIKFWLEGTDIYGNTLTSPEISLNLEFRLPTIINNLKIKDFFNEKAESMENTEGFQEIEEIVEFFEEKLEGSLYEAQPLSISATCGYFSNDWHSFTPTISLNNSLVKTFGKITPENGNG